MKFKASAWCQTETSRLLRKTLKIQGEARDETVLHFPANILTVTLIACGRFNFRDNLAP